jgi:TonB family protein
MSSCRIWLVLGVLVAASTAFAQEGSEVTHLMDDSGDRKPLQTMVPVYPQRALEDRIQGEVEVCFNVDREGRTSRIAVRHSSNRIFEKPALLAIRASSYTPLPAGKPLSGIKTCRTFRFLLDPVAITDPSEVLAVEP